MPTISKHYDKDTERAAWSKYTAALADQIKKGKKTEALLEIDPGQYGCKKCQQNKTDRRTLLAFKTGAIETAKLALKD